MSYLIKPEGYKPLLDLKQTELGIKQIKDFFQTNLSAELRLRRVTAPLFVLKGMGINDDLSGIERPVSFPIKDLQDAKAEVVHSLAKWKRGRRFPLAFTHFNTLCSEGLIDHHR